MSRDRGADDRRPGDLPAFPQAEFVDDPKGVFPLLGGTTDPGLTKRELFAALNHAALLANPDFLAACGRSGMRAEQTEAKASETARRHADALLADLAGGAP